MYGAVVEKSTLDNKIENEITVNHSVLVKSESIAEFGTIQKQQIHVSVGRME